MGEDDGLDPTLSFEQLKDIIVGLKTQLKEEKERSASLRCQLTSTMQELEELTRSLFEEANQMVSSEARKRAEAEGLLMKEHEEAEAVRLQNSKLKDKIRGGHDPLFRPVHHHLGPSSVQSTADSPLRLTAVPAHLSVRRASSQPTISRSDDDPSIEPPRSKLGSVVTCDEEEEESVYVEEIANASNFPAASLAEFKSFLSCEVWPLLSGSLGEKLQEEISLCIHISTKKGFGSRFLSKVGRYVYNWKHINDALSDGSYQIEILKKTGTLTILCSFCEVASASHQIRLMIPTHLIYNPNDSSCWSDYRQMCRFCKDRHLSVSHLYSFLRSAKTAPDDEELEDLYRELLRLRLNMYATRLIST